MLVDAALTQRYSERNFSDQKPSSQDIQELLVAARHAPNSCNMQVMHYIVIDDASLQAKLSKVATKKILWAPVNILLMIDSRVTKKRQSGVMSLGAAMQNILLKATDLGLATCPMAGFSNDEEIKILLGIPDYFDLHVFVGVGYSADANEKKRIRIPLSESMSHNTFNTFETRLNLSMNIRDWSMSDLINYRRRIAPVYRYHNRFSLAVYDHRVTEYIAHIVADNAKKYSTNSILDLITYDGMFMKQLCDIGPMISDITISDHIKYILDTTTDFQKKVKAVQIDSNHTILSDRKYDCITCINQLQFIPKYNQLIINALQYLHPGGIFVIAIPTESRFRSILKRTIRFLLAKCKYESFNVYENNPFYKFGPYQPVSMKSVTTLMKEQGLTPVLCDKICLTSVAQSNQTQYAIFVK